MIQTHRFFALVSLLGLRRHQHVKRARVVARHADALPGDTRGDETLAVTRAQHTVLAQHTVTTHRAAVFATRQFMRCDELVQLRNEDVAILKNNHTK
jgi:hypothetical protein